MRPDLAWPARVRRALVRAALAALAAPARWPAFGARAGAYAASVHVLLAGVSHLRRLAGL